MPTLIMWKGGRLWSFFPALFLESLGREQRDLSHMSAVAQSVIKINTDNFISEKY